MGKPKKTKSAKQLAFIEECFSKNIEKSHKQLMNYTFNLCGDYALSADILQNAYCRAWMAIETLKDWGSFKAWLKVIIYRENARYFATHHYHNVFDESLHSDEENSDIQAGIVSINEAAKRVDELPFKYKAVVVLHMFGFNGDEIASKLNIPVNTVYTRMKRARAKLKGDLKF
ncbi:MAG: hypothetical protein Alis3KO_38870 [Aliiglaciecola sp.]